MNTNQSLAHAQANDDHHGANVTDYLKKRKRRSSSSSEEPNALDSSPIWDEEDPQQIIQHSFFAFNHDTTEPPKITSSLEEPLIDDDESMFIPSSSSLHHTNHQCSSILLHPLFESEQDIINATTRMIVPSSSSEDSPTSSHNNNHNKRNKLSPHSHLTEFIRDNIMQYLLFHLQSSHSKTHMSNNSYSENQCIIPVGLLFDYIAQQAQRLYFNMYEYIRELALIPTSHNRERILSFYVSTANNNNRMQELSLACNEFEKLVIEQVHFLMDQVQLIQCAPSPSSFNHTTTTVIPMMRKYESILPSNFGSIKLVGSASSSGMVGLRSSTSIVDDSSLIKSENGLFSLQSPFPSTINSGYCDMTANISHNNFDISSLLNERFKFSPTLSSFLKH